MDVTWHAPVATRSQLPKVRCAEGDAHVCLQDMTVYVFVNGNWCPMMGAETKEARTSVTKQGTCCRVTNHTMKAESKYSWHVWADAANLHWSVRLFTPELRATGLEFRVANKIVVPFFALLVKLIESKPYTIKSRLSNIVRRLGYKWPENLVIPVTLDGAAEVWEAIRKEI